MYGIHGYENAFLLKCMPDLSYRRRAYVAQERENTQI